MRDASLPAGLLDSLEDIRGLRVRPEDIHPDVRRFYEHTSDYVLDLWSEWSGLFRPFGRLLAIIFSRRLEQLNIPLSPLDSSRGMTSRLIKLESPESGETLHTGWIRTNAESGATVYVGAYSVELLPNDPSPCIKVVFPLPNGSASIYMSIRSDEYGALILESSGHRFGDPGFYFVVLGTGSMRWVRHLKTFRERIRVFVDDGGELRTDHEFSIWRLPFLRLHYRMRRAEP